MKSKTAKICMSLIAMLGFLQSCDAPCMYGPGPDYPDDQDTVMRAMYGVFLSEYDQTDLTTPDICPQETVEEPFE